jgi:hypothetical protein
MLSLAFTLRSRLFLIAQFKAQYGGGHPFVVPADAAGEGAHAYGRLATLA